jgi:hypothetical protein
LGYGTSIQVEHGRDFCLVIVRLFRLVAALAHILILPQPLSDAKTILENEVGIGRQEREGQDILTIRTASDSVEHQRKLESANPNRVWQQWTETRCIGRLTNSGTAVHSGSSGNQRISLSPSPCASRKPISSIVRQDVTCPASGRGVRSTKRGDAARSSSSRTLIRWHDWSRVSCDRRRSVRCRGRRNVDRCGWQDRRDASESWISERATGSERYHTDRGEEPKETEKQSIPRDREG